MVARARAQIYTTVQHPHNNITNQHKAYLTQRRYMQYAYACAVQR